MDATLYLISGLYVSAGRARALAKQLEAACRGPAYAIRLEAEGDGLWSALDKLTQAGATRIVVRPVGLPFSQSLERWLPGAIGSWLAKAGPSAPELLIAAVAEHDPAVAAAAARASVPLTPIVPQPKGHLGKGWDMPPAARHHLLVCAGPRCHLHDAPSLIDALKAELGRAGLSEDCLVTTTGCLFPCNQGPTLVHYPAGNWYRVPDKAAVRRFVRTALTDNQIPHDLRFHKTGEPHETV